MNNNICVGAHMRRAPRRVVNPISGEGVGVTGTDEKHSPVMLAVAASRPRGATVELVVRDGNLASGTPAGYDELTAHEGEFVVVNPHPVTAIKGNGITTPNELGVQFREVNVLDDDIGRATTKTEALATNHALAAHTDDRLVAFDVNGRPGSFIVSAGFPCSVVACVPDPKLTLGRAARALCGSVVAAAWFRGGAFAGKEIEGAVDHDDRRAAARKKGHQPRGSATWLVVCSSGWMVVAGGRCRRPTQHWSWGRRALRCRLLSCRQRSQKRCPLLVPAQTSPGPNPKESKKSSS